MWLLGLFLCLAGASTVSPGVELLICVQYSLAASYIFQPCRSRLFFFFLSQCTFCLLCPPCTIRVLTSNATLLFSRIRAKKKTEYTPVCSAKPARGARWPRGAQGSIWSSCTGLHSFGQHFMVQATTNMNALRALAAIFFNSSLSLMLTSADAVAPLFQSPPPSSRALPGVVLNPRAVQIQLLDLFGQEVVDSVFALDDAFLVRHMPRCALAPLCHSNCFATKALRRVPVSFLNLSS